MPLISFHRDWTIVKEMQISWQGVSCWMWAVQEQSSSKTLNFDFSQRSLLMLNCATINRNVNYDVKTERVKVKAAQQSLKIIHASSGTVWSCRGVLLAGDLFAATKRWKRGSKWIRVQARFCLCFIHACPVPISPNLSLFSLPLEVLQIV